MKKVIILSIIALLYSDYLFAQKLNFKWEENPSLHKITDVSMLKESAIIITEKTQLVFNFDTKDNLTLTRKIHRIVKVLDDKGIESFNKIKIAFLPEFPIESVKARSILPNGKVIELKPEAFKEVKEENGQMTKLFAFEGIEKESEVEYIVEMKQIPRLYGSYQLQDEIPNLLSEFEIITPKHLLFDMKGYNNIEVIKDTTATGENLVYSVGKNMKGIEEEKMANFLDHFGRVDYTVAYNKAQKGNEIRIYTWDEAAKKVIKNYTDFPEKVLKQVSKLIEDNKEYKKLSSSKEKQDWIENYVKSSYIQQEYIDDEKSESLEFIIKNKVATEQGIRSLMTALYESQKIPYEIGFTTNRFEKTFDYSFQSWDNLNNFILYFPDTKRFMAPNETSYRMPFIPAAWTGQNGIFAKVIGLGDVKTASADKRKIPAPPAEVSTHDHDVEVHFNADMDTSFVMFKNIFKGYNAIEIMPAFVYLDGEKREEFTKQILRIGEKEEKYLDYKFENNSFTSITEGKPLIISANIHAANLLEHVGNKYLFKIGELIGPQSEMYQEKERQFDIEIPNAHQYSRILKVNIPAGYTVKNLDKLNMNVTHMIGGIENCKFTSEYRLNNQVLEVKVFEIYNYNFTQKSEFENYRKVINAAADFNKIVIVLEKL